MRSQGVMEGVIVIAASAGGLEPLRRIVVALPVPCMVAGLVVMHIGSHPSVLPSLLSTTNHPAAHAQDGILIEAGHIYVAPPDCHMIVSDGHIRLNREPKVHHTRPAADPLFISAAEEYGPQVMGIVLSVGDSDGAAGLRAITKHGGMAFVQDPEEAAIPSMPLAAIMADHPDACLPAEQIAQRVRLFCSDGCGLKGGAGATA